MSKELAFSVTIKDCEVQTFRAGGKGGQHQNKTESGVRVIHHPSGARGESRESRSQRDNKVKAFRRMAESDKFQIWVKKKLGSGLLVEEQVRKMMDQSNLLVEGHEDGKWKEID